MGLLSRGNVKDDSSGYTGGQSITITEQFEGNDLVQIDTNPLPTYNATEDAAEFNGVDQILGASATAAQVAAMKDAATGWTMLALIQSPSLTHDNDSVLTFANGSNFTPVSTLRLRNSDDSSFLVRDDSSNSVEQVAGPPITVDTPHVIHLRYDGTNLYIGVDGTEQTHDASALDVVSGELQQTLNQFSIGGIWDTSLGFFAPILFWEYRIYDSDEGANLASIVSDMKNNVAPTQTITATDGDTDVAVGQDPGFTGNVNGINLKTSDDAWSMALSLGASNTNTDPHFDMPDLLATVQAAWVVYPTASFAQLQIEVTSDDGTDTPLVVDLTRNLPVGYDVVELASVVTTSGSIFFGLTSPETVPPNTSQFVYETADTTSVAANGEITTNKNGGFINGWLLRTDTQEIEFTQVYVPGQLALASLPSDVAPSTQYTVTVENGNSVASGLVIVDGGIDYTCTIDSADIDSITFTTPSSIPNTTPTTNVEVTFPAPTP